jgi:thiol-disulfide isomerase/thioredoxin
MSSKSTIAYSHWRTGLLVIGAAVLLSGGFNLYTWQGSKAPRTVEATQAFSGETPDRVTRDLATGELAAFVVHPERKALPEITFKDEADTPLSLSQWQGRVVLVNLWATWCGPCRKEMPELAELQSRLGSQDFEVVAISIDRQGADIARPFIENVGAEALKLYLDPTTNVLSEFRAVGLPATMLIDRSGREVGRMFGPADWASPEAVRLIEAALAEGGTS